MDFLTFYDALFSKIVIIMGRNKNHYKKGTSLLFLSVMNVTVKLQSSHCQSHISIYAAAAASSGQKGKKIK
jgi:hypothetical protein